MLRIVIRDLIKVSQPEEINLKDGLEKSLPPRAFSHLLDLPEERKNRSIKTLTDRNFQRANLIDSIYDPKNLPTEYIYLPREKSSHSLTSKFLTVTRLAALGVLFVMLINFFNILNEGLLVRNTVIAKAGSAYSSLIDAADQAKNSQFSNAGDQFQLAQNYFNSALEQITFLNSSLGNQFGKEKNIDSLQKLLSAGKEISSAGKLFSEIGLNFSTLPSEFIDFNNQSADGDSRRAAVIAAAAGSRKPTLTARLHQDLELLNRSIGHLETAYENLSEVNSVFIPKNYQEKIATVKATLKAILAKLDQLQTFIPGFLKLLGDRYPYRYLVLLQNDSEARATGGFIGSYLIVDVNDGRISKLEFHDVYDSDGQLTENVPAPEEIAKITKSWGLRDSNYSPNFDRSAEKAAWFLQKSNGPSVDAVIAVNQSFLKNLLEIYGPLPVNGLRKPLTADNYQLVLSYFIESKFFSLTNPKKILDRTIEAMKEKIAASRDYTSLFGALFSGIQDQKIMLYSRDTDVQELFDHFNLTPRQTVLKPENDYLQISSISVGGNKTDQFIRQNIVHNTIIDSAGNVFDELKIDRSNQFNESYLNGWKKIMHSFGVEDVDDNVMKILGNSDNKDNIKVYLPLGTTLDHAVGINPDEVLVRSDNELQKTYFLFPMITPPGQTSSVTLRYKLPYQLRFLPASVYRFNFQPAPGVIPTTIEKTFGLDSTLKALKTFNTLGLPFTSDQLKLRSDLNRDLYLSAVLSS